MDENKCLRISGHVSLRCGRLDGEINIYVEIRITQEIKRT